MGVTSACKLAFVIYIMCLVALIVSFASPYWILVDAVVVKLNMGLWQVCIRVPDYTADCAAVTLDVMLGWERSVACLMIVALVVAVLAGCCHMYMPVTAGLQILAGALTMFAVVIFGVNVEKRVGEFEWYTDDGSPLHWAYGLAFIAGVTFVINGVILSVRSRGDMQRNLPCEASPPQEIPMYSPGGMHVQVVTQGPSYMANPPNLPYYTLQPEYAEPAPTYAEPAPTYTEPAPTYTGQYEKDKDKLVN